MITASVTVINTKFLSSLIPFEGGKSFCSPGKRIEGEDEETVVFPSWSLIPSSLSLSSSLLHLRFLIWSVSTKVSSSFRLCLLLYFPSESTDVFFHLDVSPPSFPHVTSIKQIYCLPPLILEFSVFSPSLDKSLPRFWRTEGRKLPVDNILVVSLILFHHWLRTER